MRRFLLHFATAESFGFLLCLRVCGGSIRREDSIQNDDGKQQMSLTLLCGIHFLFSPVRYTRILKETKKKVISQACAHLISKGLFFLCVPWKSGHSTLLNRLSTGLRRCGFPPRIAQTEWGPTPGSFSFPSDQGAPTGTDPNSVTPSLENHRNS